MRFTPKSDKELYNLLPDGEYAFEVMEATDTVSRSGNEMIKLKLRIYKDDIAHVVFDYLLEALAYKLSHFCDATRQLDKYDAGSLTADNCFGKKGYCTIAIDESNPSYAPKNIVQDYTKANNAMSVTPTTPAAPQDDFDDTIPF